jgi:superfamily II DNA or RNA helicase
MLLSRRGFFLPKISKFCESIKNKLLVTPNINAAFDFSDEGPVSFNVFQENDTHLIIPRFFATTEFKNEKYENQIKINNPREFKFKGSLRDYQQKIIDTIIPKIKETGGGLLSIPTGRGKTILAVKLACELKLKTLFVVHKTFFLEQTKEKYELFSDAKIGILQQKIIDIENKDVVIGMLQSICSRDYGEEVMGQFDLVIFDECHHMSSREFSKALTKIRPVYTIGLSATPKRSDGIEKVFHWYAGPMLYQETAAMKHVVHVKTVNFDIKHYKFKNVKNKKGQDLLPIVVTNLTEIEQRNDLIVKEILDLKLLEPERKFLILSGRREHLNILANMIKQKHPSLEDEVGFYVGGMKKDQLKNASEKSLIFATFEMASEGLDILALDTLFMLTPKGNVNQSVGRILRKQFDEYEYPPLIIDFVDEIESVKRLAMIRMRLYKSRDYVINGVEPEVKETKELEIKELMPIGIDTNPDENINKKKQIKTKKIDFNSSLF